VAVVFVCRMRLDVFGVAVLPEQEFLEYKERSDAGEQRNADIVHVLDARALDGVRHEREQRRAEQRAGRKTHEMRHEPLALRTIQKQHDAGEYGACDPTQGGERDDGGEVGHTSDIL